MSVKNTGAVSPAVQSWRDGPSRARAADPGGQRPRAYSDLAGWLARAIPTNPTRLREVVCGLHRGITAGILSQLDPKAKLTELELRDPESAGLVIEVRGAAEP